MSTPQLYIYDDEVARRFDPFALTRPLSELRVGAVLTRNRWERVLGKHVSALVSADHLQNFAEPGAPEVCAADHVLRAGSAVVNSRFIPSLGASLQLEPRSILTADGMIAGMVLESDASAREIPALLDSAPSQDRGGVPMDGRWLSAVWDLISTLPEQLTQDIQDLAADRRLDLQHVGTRDAEIIGDQGVYRAPGCTIEPFVVFDASAGPILVDTGAIVSSFTRVTGPCYIGRASTVLGDRVGASSIGDHCKVRGEVSNTVMVAYSNKGHTGFVGHSYIGRWVNLGAGTTTSNLKNTYGSVQLRVRDETLETGQQFLGTLFGDHAKTGIGTMLTTGTIVGAGANVFGSHSPPKYVPPFSWGDCTPYDVFELRKFLDVAGRMMARRQIDLGEGGRAYLTDVYHHADATR